MSGQSWPPEETARLAGLWEAGISSGRIAKLLGRTRSSVICRAHRMELTPRARTLPRAPKPYVPPGGSPVQLPMLPDPGPPGAKRVPLRLWLVPTTPPRECQWPTGEKPHVRFCEAPAVSARPYCVRHCRVAFIGFGHPRPTGHAWVSP